MRNLKLFKTCVAAITFTYSMKDYQQNDHNDDGHVGGKHECDHAVGDRAEYNLGNGLGLIA